MFPRRDGGGQRAVFKRSEKIGVLEIPISNCSTTHTSRTTGHRRGRPHKHLHNAAAGRAVSVVVNVVSEERIGDAQHGDDLAHGDVLGDRHGQLDELFRTELVHDLGEEFIVDGIVVVPEAVSERERCPLASRQPRIVDLAVHHRIGQFLLDVLLSRPGQKTSVASIVALVEAGDPEAGDLLGA